MLSVKHSAQSRSAPPEAVMTGRSVPLIVVSSAAPGVADEVAERLRRAGAVAYPTHSAEGCLRVATSVAPDIVLLDQALPRRFEELLRAHPACARTRLLHLSDATLRSLASSLPPTRNA